MKQKDLRPPVWIGHVVLETDRLEESAEFMRKLGMRPIVQRAEVTVLELRGGTHLVLIAKPEITSGDAPFDLMVEDLQENHRRFAELGLRAIVIRPCIVKRECASFEFVFMKHQALLSSV